MTMNAGLGWSMLSVAVLANVVANVSLRHAVRGLEPQGPVSVVLGLLASPAAWLGVASAGLLLAAYMTAIRVLPLSICYAAVTVLAMIGLTIWGGLTGTEAITPLRLVGLGLAFAGIALLVTSA
jgi:multidrug transporter EmrE-like cation transporter